MTTSRHQSQRFLYVCIVSIFKTAQLFFHTHTLLSLLIPSNFLYKVLSSCVQLILLHSTCHPRTNKSPGREQTNSRQAQRHQTKVPDQRGKLKHYSIFPGECCYLVEHIALYPRLITIYCSVIDKGMDLEDYHGLCCIYITTGKLPYGRKIYQIHTMLSASATNPFTRST